MTTATLDSLPDTDVPDHFGSNSVGVADVADESDDSHPLAPPPMTPEEFEQFDDDGLLYELVDGVPVEKPMSDFANATANHIKDLLHDWAKPLKAGRSYVESTFQCYPGRPSLVRRPDVAFISTARLRGYSWRNAHARLAPDLAIEVVSPRDRWYDVVAKVAEYHSAGVPLVLVADPIARTLHVHPHGGKLRVLTADDEFDGGGVLPGFRHPVADLFPARDEGAGEEPDEDAGPAVG